MKKIVKEKVGTVWRTKREVKENPRESFVKSSVVDPDPTF